MKKVELYWLSSFIRVALYKRGYAAGKPLVSRYGQVLLAQPMPKC